MPRLPETMRAVQLVGHGGVDKLIYREDLPLPPLSEGDVLVRVRACGLNNTDINTRVAWYGGSVSTGITKDVAINGTSAGQAEYGTWNREGLSFPRIQGAAAVGTIVAVGAGIDAGRIGERVVTDPVVRSVDLPIGARGVSYVGSERDGGYADYLAVPSQNALVVRQPIAFAQLAALPCAYQTAEEMQIRAEVGPMDTVVVTGASGGVGLANVQLAKLRGARVVAVCGRDKRGRVRGHGADVVLAREDGPIGDQLQAVLGERGASVVLDVVGTDDVGALWALLARGGRFATGGAIAGPFSKVDMRDLIYKDLRVLGIANPEPQALRNLISCVEDGRLVPVVDRLFPLRQLAEAQAVFAGKDHVGKIVIEVSGD